MSLRIIFLLSILLICFTNVSFGFSKNFRGNLHREPFPIYNNERNLFVDELWIVQKLDNFDAKNNRTWQMRYLENRQHFKNGGPIFIYVGGEWTISPGAITGGHLYDMAREMGGILFYTEHRYYGNSHPTKDTSFENLKWLSIDQALADLAHFVKYTKQTNPELKNSGVIMLGGSYSGTMVTWFRLKYPELVNGVWASSAPLEAKLDFFEYKETMGEGFKYIGGSDCYYLFHKAYAEIEQLIKDGKTKIIDKELNLCTPLNGSNTMDVWNLFNELSENVASVSQYASPNAIKDTCTKLTDDKYSTAFESYAAWTRAQLQSNCFKHEYSEFVKMYRQTAWNSTVSGHFALMSRPWTYQTCTEYGWYQTSNSRNQPFGSSYPPELFIKMCADYFDKSLTRETIEASAKRINEIYGGYYPNMTNVYFTQGQLDPWRTMGRETDLNENAPAVVIPLIAHVADTGSITSNDVQELVESKQRVTKLVKQWLN